MSELRVSVVMPSLNQSGYIAEGIESVLSQDHDDVELLVVDGGSTDGSEDIIRSYADEITWWVSEPDRGQSHAINKGLSRATGDVVAWLNSDDVYLEGAISRVVEAVTETGADWVVGQTVISDLSGGPEALFVPRTPRLDVWTDLVCTKVNGVQLPQPSTFWSAEALRQVGLLNEELHLAMDHEYWIRLGRSGHRPLVVDRPLAVLRRHSEQKTARGPIAFWEEELAIVRNLLPTLEDENDEGTLRRYARHLKGKILRKRATSFLRGDSW